MDTHKQGMMEAQQAHTDAARRQKEIDAQANKLGSHLDKAKAHANQMDTTTAKHSDSEFPSSLSLFHGYPSNNCQEHLPCGLPTNSHTSLRGSRRRG